MDLRNGKFCGLNPTAAEIWRALQNSGVMTQSLLVDELQVECSLSRSDVERHVELFLNAMVKKALVRKVEDGVGYHQTPPSQSPGHDDSNKGSSPESVIRFRPVAATEHSSDRWPQ